jgi:hypothetical protein
VTPEQQAAMKELGVKSLKVIQIETAKTWAHRAWAAYTMAHTLANSTVKDNLDQTVRWLHDAVEYEHEAIEHAALTGDDALLVHIRNLIHQAKQ